MNYKIVNGSISYGADTILEEINFEIKEKEKIAIVGRNGCGKTTLLKALINNEVLEEGIGDSKFGVYKQGKISIGYLKQIEFENDSNTLLDEILKVYEPIISLHNKILKLEEEMKLSSNDKLLNDYTNLVERFKLIGGYTYKKEYETVITKFGFSNEDRSKKISEFSGGQKTKIAFIKLLLLKPDILLLDEPTNNLDITTIEWLESYLKDYPKSVVIVSHDRMFLDKIVNKVYEIEYGTMTEYTGNYNAFELQKKSNYEKRLKDYEYQQKEIKRLQAIADRFRYKPTKAKMALSKLKKIEQMVIIEEPNKYDLKSFKTNFNVDSNSGSKVLSVRNLKVGYDKVLCDISFDLYRNDKIGIIGANGMGKSTLLKTLVGKIPSLGGEFEYGYNVRKEYFDQQISFEDGDITVLDEFSNKFPDFTITEVRSALACFLFSGEDVNKEINVLSGGEKIRLQLCEMLYRKPNLLFLDEPTNHMDIIGKESLEHLLKNYEGTLIFVSHDRYFVNKIANSLIIFTENGARFFRGTYDEYINTKSFDEEKCKNTPLKKEKNLDNKEKYNARKKVSKIENEISKKEERKKELEDIMQSDEICSDYVKLASMQEEVQVLEDSINTLMEEWEKLSSKLDNM